MRKLAVVVGGVAVSGLVAREAVHLYKVNQEMLKGGDDPLSLSEALEVVWEHLAQTVAPEWFEGHERRRSLRQMAGICRVIKPTLTQGLDDQQVMRLVQLKEI